MGFVVIYQFSKQFKKTLLFHPVNIVNNRYHIPNKPNIPVHNNQTNDYSSSSFFKTPHVFNFHVLLIRQRNKVEVIKYYCATSCSDPNQIVLKPNKPPITITHKKQVYHPFHPVCNQYIGHEAIT